MLHWRIARRFSPPGELLSLIRLAATFGVSLVLAGVLLWVQNKPGLRGILLLLEGGFGDIAGITAAAAAEAAEGGWWWFPVTLVRGLFWDNYALADTLLKSIPIFLCSLGVAICFHLQVWNIGAEGQFVLGAIGGTGFVLAFPGLPAWLMLPGMFAAAAFAGGLWAVIPAVLRQYCRTNEIISTLMLNYIAMYLVEYLVFGPWKDPHGMNMPMTMPFPEAAVVPAITGRIHWGLGLCVITACGVYIFLNKTRAGYELFISGAKPKAARYAGIRYGAMVIGVMCLCGALAAWAGCIETSVTLERLRPNVAAGYGYIAIVVAWLARLRISRIVIFSLLLASLRVGVENLQLELQVSAAFGQLLQGLILLMVLAGQFFDGYRITALMKKG